MGLNNKLKFASSVPWLKAKTDSPNIGILLNPNNLRWEVHQAEARKSDELKLKEYTQRLIKNNTKTTWRTYAADAAHGVGEGLMMLNPYTTGAYFGGKALDNYLKGNDLEAVANTGFAAMPWAGSFLPKLMSSVESIGKGVNKGMQVLNSPLTGKWTLFGNKEVRLAPGYIGMNGGSPLETRRVATLDRIQRELNQRIGRNATPDEINLFLRENQGIHLGTANYPNRGMQTVIAGLSGDFDNALTNLNRRIQGKYTPVTPMTLRGPFQLQLFRVMHNQESPINVDEEMVKMFDYFNQPLTGPAISTRSAEEVKNLGRYSREDVLLPNGSPNPNLRPSWLDTGSHGNFIDVNSSPNKVFSNLVNLVNNPGFGRGQFFQVLRANPRGRSGVIVHTHSGDLSTDSHGLAHKTLLSQGFKELVPLKGNNFEGRVTANNFGYKNLFVDLKDWDFDPALQQYINNNPGKVELNGNTPYYVKRDTDGSLNIYNSSSNKAAGRIQAKKPENVLEDAFNSHIRSTNAHFGINLPEAKLGNYMGEYPLWTFRRDIEYPSFGIWGALGLKHGGKLLKK